MPVLEDEHTENVCEREVMERKKIEIERDGERERENLNNPLLQKYLFYIISISTTKKERKMERKRKEYKSLITSKVQTLILH